VQVGPMNMQAAQMAALQQQQQAAQQQAQQAAQQMALGQGM
jgi:hypothetical protein